MKANEMFKSSRLLCARGCTDVAVGGNQSIQTATPGPSRSGTQQPSSR